MKIVLEKILRNPDRSFATLDKRATAFDGRFHFHPEVEITLIESSSGRRVVGDSIEPFGPGDLVLLGENLPHQYVSDPTSRDAPAVAKVIQFRSDFLGEAWLALPEFRHVAAMLDERAARGLTFDAETMRRASQLIERLFAAADVKRLALLLELLDLLARDARATPIASAGYLSKINTREGDAIDRALEYLNTNYTEAIALEDLS